MSCCQQAPQVLMTAVIFVLPAACSVFDPVLVRKGTLDASIAEVIVASDPLSPPPRNSATIA